MTLHFCLYASLLRLNRANSGPMHGYLELGGVLMPAPQFAAMITQQQALSCLDYRHARKSKSHVKAAAKRAFAAAVLDYICSHM